MPESELKYNKLLKYIDSLDAGFIAVENDFSISVFNQKAKDLLEFADTDTQINVDNIQNRLETEFNFKAALEDSFNDNPCKKVARIGGKKINISINPVTQANNIVGSTIILQNMKSADIEHRKSEEEFLVIASHNLKDPLTLIIGYIALFKDLYLNEIDNAQIKEIFNSLEVASTNLTAIINDFIDMLKLENETLEINTEAVELNEIIENTINKYESKIMNKGLYINFIKAAPSTAVVDKSRLKQVISYIIENALRNTYDGGIQVSTEKSGDKFIKILIKDTGIGISDESKLTLFNKFPNVERGKYIGETKGTGLGLYISRLLMEKIGGEIKLEESTIDKGSTFSIIVPIKI